MTTTINGTTGVSLIQDGVVVQADLATNVAGNGPAFKGAVTGASMPNNSLTKPNVSEIYDTNNAFNPTGSKFQPTVAGYYQFNLSFELSGAMVNGYSAIYLNNVIDTKGSQGNLVSSNTSALILMNGTTDYVEAVLFQTSGGALNANIVFTGFLARAA